jgi:hypothetical protein
VHLVGFITKKSVTMHGHMNQKPQEIVTIIIYVCSRLKRVCERTRTTLKTTQNIVSLVWTFDSYLTLTAKYRRWK